MRIKSKFLLSALLPVSALSFVAPITTSCSQSANVKISNLFTNYVEVKSTKYENKNLIVELNSKVTNKIVSKVTAINGQTVLTNKDMNFDVDKQTLTIYAEALVSNNQVVIVPALAADLSKVGVEISADKASLVNQPVITKSDDKWEIVVAPKDSSKELSNAEVKIGQSSLSSDKFEIDSDENKITIATSVISQYTGNIVVNPTIDVKPTVIEITAAWWENFEPSYTEGRYKLVIDMTNPNLKHPAFRFVNSSYSSASFITDVIIDTNSIKKDNQKFIPYSIDEDRFLFVPLESKPEAGVYSMNFTINSGVEIVAFASWDI